MLLAPLGVVPAAACALALGYAIEPQVLEGGLVLSCLVGFYGVPISYVATAIVGMPAARLLWRAGHRSFATTVGLGAALGVVIAAVVVGGRMIGRVDWTPGSLGLNTNLWSVGFALALFGLCGAFVAAIYWLVGLDRSALPAPMDSR